MDIVKRKLCLINLETNMGLIEDYWKRANEADSTVYTGGKDNIIARTDKIVFKKMYDDLKFIKEALEE